MLLRLVVLGEGGTGKSSLTIQYTQNVFILEYDPTIENNHRKQIILGTVTYMLDILDTAGEEEYSAMYDVYLREADVVMLLFTLQYTQKLDNALSYYIPIIRSTRSDIPILLVGTKCDLVPLQVSQEMGESFASELSLNGFIQTSAKENSNISEAFDLAIPLAIKYKNSKTPMDYRSNERERSHTRKCLLM